MSQQISSIPKWITGVRDVQVVQPETRMQVPKPSTLDKIMGKFGLLDYLIKPVYNAGQFTTPVVIPFDQDALTGQTFTISSSTLARTGASINGTTYFHVCDHGATVQQNDTGLILHEGNDTAFDRLYVWFPDLDIFASKLSLNVAFGMNVSAHTAGNFSLTSATLDMYALDNNFSVKQIFKKTYLSGLGNLAATGTQIFIVDDEIIVDKLLYGGYPVIFNWSLSVAKGTGTSQEGTIPWHPYQLANAPKTFGRTEIKIHANAAITHGNKILRQQENMKMLDYGGIAQSGEIRA